MAKYSSLVACLILLSFTISGFVKNELVLSEDDSSGISLPPIHPVMPFAMQYQEFFQSQLDSCGCPGAAVAIIKDDVPLLTHGFGVKNLNSMDPIGIHTNFRIGSLSKGFASVLTGMMVEQNNLDWSDKVVDMIPYFSLHSPEQTKRIQVKHILSHTTGLPIHSYTNLVEDGLSIQRIAKELHKVPLIGKEGEIYAYQNAAYSLIEKVLQTKTNKSYPSLLNDEIFKPMGMVNASSSYEGIKNKSDRAEPYMLNRRSNQYKKRKINRKYYNSVSSGGINASISDMSKYLSLLLGNHPQIISEEGLDGVFKPEIKTSNARRYFNKWPNVSNSYYAHGWRVIDYQDRRIIHHGGYVNGYRGEIAVDRENELAICVLFNSPCKYAEKVVPEFLELFDQFQDKWITEQIDSDG